MSEKGCCGNFIVGHDEKHCIIPKLREDLSFLRQENAALETKLKNVEAMVLEWSKKDGKRIIELAGQVDTLEAQVQTLREALNKNKTSVSNLECDCIAQDGPCLRHEIEESVDKSISQLPRSSRIEELKENVVIYAKRVYERIGPYSKTSSDLGDAIRALESEESKR